MNFLATPADLRAWFLRVEANWPLHCARMGAFSYPDTPVHATIAGIPDLQEEDAPRSYLVPPGTPMGRRSPELARGGPWFYVDGHSEENRVWPILKPSVIVDDVMEEGWCSLDVHKADQQPLNRL